jgi:hypothetical protein
MLCFFAYGMARFPDSPIHPCKVNHSCGKQGQPHTYDDFRAFAAWQTTFTYAWPAGIFALVLLKRKQKS